MVAYFFQDGERRFFPRYEVDVPWGLPVLKVGIPARFSPRRLARLARRLYGRGLRRYLPGEGVGELHPLVPVDPLPLCRAKGADMALVLLQGVELRERRVALRGERADSQALRLAEDLCPRVGALLLDFDWGEEELASYLRDRYGAACLHLGQDRPPLAAVELAPRPLPLHRTLALWGEPKLQGLTLGAAGGPLPPGFPKLPFLELLWETGRVSLEEILAEPEAE